MRYAAVAQAGSAFEAPGRHTRLKLAEHRGSQRVEPVLAISWLIMPPLVMRHSQVYGRIRPGSRERADDGVYSVRVPARSFLPALFTFLDAVGRQWMVMITGWRDAGSDA
jgi:hypothetical protein